MASIGEAIVNYARQQLGDPYVWGAEGPDSFDCSGLVYAAYRAAGLDVSRTTAANLGRQGQAIPLANARAGDLVYYDKPGATDHVGIYVGNGQMIEAPTAGQNVRVSGIGSPTSIRRIGPVEAAYTGSGRRSGGGSFGDGSQYGDASDWLPGYQAPGGGLGDVRDWLPGYQPGEGGAADPFGSWQTDAVSIGLKIVAAGACVALAVVGARTALAKN